MQLKQRPTYFDLSIELCLGPDSASFLASFCLMRSNEKGHVRITNIQSYKEKDGLARTQLTGLIASPIKDGPEQSIKPRGMLKRTGDGGAVLLLNKDVRGSSHDEESK